MTAAPVFLPHVSISGARQPEGRNHLTAMRPQAKAFAAKAPANWQLTDRGIAVVMVLACVIMTVAVVVIGLTAMRVTSADYDAGSHTTSGAQH